MRTPAIAAMALTVALVASHADAQSAAVAAGRAAFENASFGEAASIFDGVRTDAHASLADLAEAYRYLSTLRLAVGDPASAERYANAALALAPDAHPPIGAPPEADALFARVHAARGAVRIRPSLTFAADPRPNEAAAVRVQIEADAPVLDAHVQGRCTVDDREVARFENVGAQGQTITTAPLPDRGEIACEATLQTAAGVVLDHAQLRASVTGGTTGGAHPVGMSPWVYAAAGAGAMAIVAGVVIAIVAASSGGADTARLGGAHFVNGM